MSEEMKIENHDNDIYSDIETEQEKELRKLSKEYYARTIKAETWE
ncbi:MAG: hypothetical protein ACE5HN_01170 [Nitrospiria bacterium]